MTLPPTLARPLVGGPFALRGHDDQLLTSQSLIGRHVLLYFGFSHCKVVCPRALARSEAALTELGEAADQIQALFVTVDPERDTPAVLRAFLAPFPHFRGLTGDKAAVDAARRAFRVFAQRIDREGDYVVQHSSLTYLLDEAGTYVDHFADTASAQAMAATLRARLPASA